MLTSYCWVALEAMGEELVDVERDGERATRTCTTVVCRA